MWFHQHQNNPLVYKLDGEGDLWTGRTVCCSGAPSSGLFLPKPQITEQVDLYRRANALPLSNFWSIQSF